MERKAIGCFAQSISCGREERQGARAVLWSDGGDASPGHSGGVARTEREVGGEDDGGRQLVAALRGCDTVRRVMREKAEREREREDCH
jgi:hypothetical protein